LGKVGQGGTFGIKKQREPMVKRWVNLDDFIKRFKGKKLFGEVRVVIVHVLPTEYRHTNSEVESRFLEWEH
jgi:hypothetical protein